MPASPGYRRKSNGDQSPAIRRSAQRLRRDLFRTGHPRASFLSPLLCGFSGGLLDGRADLDWETDQINEATRVLLIVLGAHSEAGDVHGVQRVRRLAAY